MEWGPPPAHHGEAPKKDNIDYAEETGCKRHDKTRRETWGTIECDFQEDRGATVSLGFGLGNEGQEIEMRREGYSSGSSCVCPTQHATREGPTGEGQSLPHPAPPGFPSGRRETETGHQTTERMTHRVQRYAQAGETSKSGQEHLTQSHTMGFNYLGSILFFNF